MASRDPSPSAGAVSGAVANQTPQTATPSTPGPWQVHLSHIYTADPERALICQVWNPGSRAEDYPIEANARLMGASPELLDALMRVVAIADRKTVEFDAARAAIAKATGAPCEYGDLTAQHVAARDASGNGEVRSTDASQVPGSTS
jgi:hypothetical protein